jgi:HEAT repeat protein
MKSFVSALVFCISLLVLLSVFLFPPVAAKENTLLVLLNLPAPAPPNPQVRRIGQDRDQKFYSKNNPPKDNAPIDEILDYWSQQNNTYQRLRYNAEPTEKVKQRIMDEIARNPKLLPGYLNVLDHDSADFVKRIYDNETGDGGLDKESRRMVRDWLTYNSPYYSDQLAELASNVTDSNEYVTNQEELLALTRVDFDKARPLIDRLNLDPSLKTSRVLAKWALYRHALDTDAIGDIEQYRDELKAIVEDKTALPGMRDLAMDALVSEKEWSGRDDWYISLLSDETLADLRVNGTSYTGLTTLMLVSPDGKYVEKMLGLVNSGNKTVRAAAVRNLILMVEQGPEVIKALLPWLEDSDWAVDTGDTRAAILRKLADYQIPESVPGLIKILDEKGVQQVSTASMAANAMANAANAMANSMAPAVIGRRSSLPVNTVPSSTNSAYYGPPVAYPYRSAAVSALSKQKDGRAVPALRRILPYGESYERSMIVKALLDCGGFTVAEQMDALETGIKAENGGEVGDPSANTNAYYYTANVRPGNITPAETKQLLSQQLMGATEISDELARAIVDRIELLDTKDPKLAAGYRHAILRWQNVVINIMLLRDVKRNIAGPDTMVRLLGQRKDLREKQSSDVSDLRTGSPAGVGIAACILDDPNDYAAILESGETEARIAMLACARLLRVPLTVSKVAENLKSPDQLLQIAAERYLESEDSVEARLTVLARHPNEARIMGATTAFYVDSSPGTESEYLWMLYQSLGDNSLYYGWGGSGNDSEIKAVEKRLQDEVKKDADLLGVYWYDGNYIRIYRDRAIFSWEEDESRYRERPLSKEEYDEIRAYLAGNKVDELPPFVACGGGYCTAKELLMLGKNGGRRVYVNGGGEPGGGDYPFFDGLEKYFARLKKTRATLKYALSSEMPGLEILLASEDLKAATVWKGADLRVAASDTAVRKKVESEINASDPDGNVANEEGASDENVQKKAIAADKRRYEGFSWYKVADAEVAGIASQPPDVEFIPIQDGLGIPASDEQWKARLGGIEIRTSGEGLFKVVGGRLIKLRDGAYSHAVLVPGGRWMLVARSDDNGVETTVRVNLLTNREFPVQIEGYGQRYPVTYIPTLNKVLIVRDDSYEGEESSYIAEDKEDAAPSDADPSGMLLVDPATGSTQPIAGEFRPISQQTFRSLQKTSRPNEYWAAIPDPEKNETQVGIYDTNHFGFRSVLRIPKIKFNSMYMWADEAGGKLYFVYRGHLLALPLPK